MNWPRSPVEQIDHRDFKPPHCPWPECRFHRLPPDATFRFHRHGVFIRKSDRRVIPRFRCSGCCRTCSQQTFSVSYYLKRPNLLQRVAACLQAGSAHRQIGRTLRCSHTTVMHMAERLGRHALLLHQAALNAIPTIDEPLNHDDFETFAFSQDQPMGIGTTVGCVSWFIYSLQCSPHRRRGKKRRRPTKTAVPRFAPGAYRRAFRHVLDLLLERRPPGKTLEIISDDHPAYRGGVRRHPERERIRHRVFRNPRRAYKGASRSRAARRRDREMFAVDLLHSLLRHSLSHHRRETIAFGRRHNALMERAFLMILWRNFIKRRSERRSDPTTPAMTIGLVEEPWDWKRALAKRLFPSRTVLPEAWAKIYRREWKTHGVGRNRVHRLAQAY